MSTALEQKQAQRIAFLEKQHEQDEKEKAQLRNANQTLVHQNTNQTQVIQFQNNENKWLGEFFANKEFSATQKVGAWGMRQLERKYKHLARDEDGLIPVFMKELGDMLGISAKSAGQIVRGYADALLIARQMVGTSDGKDYKKRVFMLSGETLRIRPGEAKLTKPRNHGGKREKRPTCPDCGSPNLTRSTHDTCHTCGIDTIISTKEFSGIEDIPEPHPVFEELPVARPALTLVPTCVEAEPVEESEPYVDPYDEPDVKPAGEQKKVATRESFIMHHGIDSQVATPTVKSPLDARVCHNCGNANRLLWKYNTVRAKWECLVCYHYSDEYGQITS